MVKNFCHICGTKLDQKEEFIWHCSGCNSTIYANPKPCVDIALFDESGKILMARRGRDPDKGKLGLPGGFIDIDETAEEALFREIKEELDLEKTDISPLTYVSSRLHDYPFGKEVYKNLVFVFCAELKASKSKIKARDDVSETLFLDVSDLATPEVASEEHIRHIQLAFKKYQETNPKT